MCFLFIDFCVTDKEIKVMNDEYIFRQRTASDIEELNNLALLAFSDYATVLEPDSWNIMKGKIGDAEWLKALHTTTTCFVCTRGEQIAGAAYLVPHGNPTAMFAAEWCYIRMVGVHPEHRGRGIAKILTQMCVDEAVRTGENVVALHTSEFMDAARHIYESMGFRVVKDIGLVFGKQYWVYTLDINR